MALSCNEAGIELIKGFESCRLTAYKCPAGVWTIGWGTTRGVKPGMKISQGEADEMFLEDLERFEVGVEKALAGSRVTSNQFSAFVSLAYNIGVGAFSKSTALKRHRNGNYKGAADAVLMWNKAGGKVLRGLVRRRAAERALYLTPDVAEQPPVEAAQPDLRTMTPNERDEALKPPAGCLAALLGMFK